MATEIIEITEETEVQYDNVSDLSYYETGLEYIDLYIKDEYAGRVEVWHDSEMDGREYITLNYEIIYLDTIELINPE